MAQFAALALTWGSSFFFIKIALTGLAPAEVALGRLSAGAIALLVIAAVTRQRLPSRPAVWAHLTVVAVLLCAVPFTLFGWAEEHVSSGLASIYNAATPLMTMLVTLVALPEERPSRTGIAGLVTGFAGVLVVLGPWRKTGADDWLAQAACLLAALCYGLAFVYLRRFVTPCRLPAISVAAAQVSIGAVLMAALAPAYLTGQVRLNAGILASVAVLGVAGTGLAYLWNTNIVAGWGATNAATVTYLTPLVGVALGAAALGEAITWNEPAGALIVVAGVALGQGTLPRKHPTPSHPGQLTAGP